MNNEELTDYQKALNAQIQLELDQRGAAGVPWDDVPADLFNEATTEAEKVVGDNPF